MSRSSRTIWKSDTLLPKTPSRLLQAHCDTSAPVLSPHYGEDTSRKHSYGTSWEAFALWNSSDYRESGRTFGLLLSYGSLTQESDRAHKMAFVPANLRMTLSCPSDWESDMVRTALFFPGEITPGSPDSDSRNFLSCPRAFSTLEIIQVNIQNLILTRVANVFQYYFFLVLPRYFLKTCIPWACQTHK